jgi:D-alanyl-D-alanine carboxypeptidase
MTTRRMAAIAASGVVAVTLLLTGCGGDHARALGQRGLGSELANVVAAGVPGALVVVTGDSGTLRVARGVANRATGDPMRATDRFRVGSITKSFVAACVLQLVAEGKLALDARIGRWLPGLVPDAVTVRHLLAHTSGLADYVDDPSIVSAEISSPRQLIRLALARPTIGAPGERYLYASTNYLLLGLLVERVTGTTLEDELAERIFRPLKLRRTSFEPGAPRLHVHGYRPHMHDGIVSGAPEDTQDESAAWAWSAGAIVSDAGDLARFFADLVTGRVVSKPLLGNMIPTDGSGYGLGLAAFTTSCGTAIGHTGNLGGYVSVVWTTRSADRIVVLMGNAYPLTPEADAAIHRVLDDAFCGATD